MARLDRATRQFIEDVVEREVNELDLGEIVGELPADFDPGNLASQLLAGLNFDGITGQPGAPVDPAFDPGDLASQLSTGLLF